MNAPGIQLLGTVILLALFSCFGVLAIAPLIDFFQRRTNRLLRPSRRIRVGWKRPDRRLKISLGTIFSLFASLAVLLSFGKLFSKDVLRVHYSIAFVIVGTTWWLILVWLTSPKGLVSQFERLGLLFVTISFVLLSPLFIFVMTINSLVGFFFFSEIELLGIPLAIGWCALVFFINRWISHKVDLARKPKGPSQKIIQSDEITKRPPRRLKKFK